MRFGIGVGVCDCRAAPWTPSRLSGLRLWATAGPAWCFSDAGGAAACGDGDAVYVWKDRSGNAYDLSQSSGGKRPLLVSSGGAWRVRFDGADDMLRNTSVPDPGNTLSMFAVHQMGATAGIVVYKGGVDGLGLRAQDPTTGSVLYEGVGDNSFAADDSSSALRLWQFRRNPSSLQVWSESTLRLDAAGGSPSASQPTTIFSAGNGGNGTNKAYGGDVCEAVVFGGYVSDADRLLVEAYLRAAWGVA